MNQGPARSGRGEDENEGPALPRIQFHVLALAGGKTHRTRRAIDRAIAFMERNYMRNLPLRDIAAAACLSPFHFSRLFKRVMGVSPHQYLIQMRLTRAYSLITDAPHALTEIATAVGFNDQSHLNRHFKRTFKMQPGALRARSGSTADRRLPVRISSILE